MAGQCEVHPPVEDHFAPELEWHWQGSAILPEHNQVMMTPVVVDVSGDGIPDVIFHTFAGSHYQANGVMRAISGDTGRDLWAVTNEAHRVSPGASIAAGDIDKDGRVDLCTIPSGGEGVICFENTGALKFRTTLDLGAREGVSLADLEGDGRVELIAGRFVLGNTGAVKWEGSAGSGPLSFAADIDQDGFLEVITGHSVYRHDGSLKCSNGAVGNGYTGSANFDEDPYGEIVVVWGGHVSLLDQDCEELWRTDVPGGGGGAPNIADFDGDGQPEVGVAGSDFYVVFEANGGVKWTSKTQDHSSQVTGSSTFDFEGDGKAEVVYADEVRLRVYDGSTGTVRVELPHASGTILENPVIVDVDGDDNAEIVVASNNYTFSGPTGIRAFRDRRDGWVNTRPIWNQHPYSVTHIDNDGSIPAHPATNWLTPGLNTFRSNSQGNGSLSPFAAADLTIAPTDSECMQHLAARVRNQGDAAASAGLKIAFYQDDPATGGTLLGVTTLTRKLEAGQEVIVEPPNPLPTGITRVRAVVDDDGTGTGRELECREDNNTAILQLDVTPPAAGEDKKPSLWPPNHSYHTLKLSDCAADAWDECSGTLPVDQVGRITHVTSDEVEDATGQGDGHTCEDVLILDSRRVRLRAEREGASDGRVYTVHYVITDTAGNVAEARCTVHVPHDQSGRSSVDSGPASCVGEGCPDGLGRSPRCMP
ncbi:VCBS repeat-containing protein [Cystobacter fuscus]|nr:VCBS repeat-containing protein [Cystobacter fuscus]